MNIRPFRESDHRSIQRLLKQAQVRDRTMDPWLAGADEMMGDYLTRLFEDMDQNHGALLVATRDESDDGDRQDSRGEECTGFVAVLGACQDHDIDEIPHTFGFISDLVVDDAYSDSGLADQLLGAAESHVRDCSVNTIRVSVLAANEAVRRRYVDSGYSERLVQFEKPLSV